MNPIQTNHQPINPGMPQNEVAPNTFRNFNTFPMSYRHYLTARYGDITPFFVFDAWSADKVPFASFHELRNPTMTAPLMTQIKMHKDYFLVPYRAILPESWEYFITPPTHGNDVPNDVAPIIYLNFITTIFQRCKSFNFLNTSVSEDNPDYGVSLSTLIKSVLLLEHYFSDGSLLSLLGCKASKYINFSRVGGDNDTFESWLTGFYSGLKDVFTEFDAILKIGTKSYQCSLAHSGLINDHIVSWHRFLELMRENSDFTLSISSDISEHVRSLCSYMDYLRFSTDLSKVPVNVSRLIAYQLVNSHFNVNDKIDFVYTADLWRDKIRTITYRVPLISSPLIYQMNGIKHFYDLYSLNYNQCMFVSVPNDISTDLNLDIFNAIYQYFYELVIFHKSLKFGDYFTGSRPRPLAVGDPKAPVVQNGVSAIDMTKNILWARFLNAVNKTSRKLDEYQSKILGGYEQPDPKDPKYLTRDTLSLGQQEIENTAEDQGNIVTLLRSEQSKYAFEADVSEPSIILGVCSFEAERAYSRTIDRHFFKKDRYDMFNPYMQNVGDQEVWSAEKGLGSLDTSFAYNLRHSEYKQRFSIASAGFVNWLPAWSMIADNQEGNEDEFTNISPDFIRSTNSEFDRFYSSLTGDTLASYFHFILKFDNESTPIRNMEFNPTIL